MKYALFCKKNFTIFLIIFLFIMLQPLSEALSFDQRQLKLIEGAKKEGEFLYVSNMFGTEEGKILTKAFKKYYGLEDLEIKFSRIVSKDLVRRTEEELRAGKLKTDVIITTVVEWAFDLARRGKLLKYKSPEYVHYGPAEKAGMNNPGYWVSDVGCYSIIYNPQYIKKEIKSWNDLLDPNFAGKLSMGNVEQSAGYTLNYFVLRKVLPKEYFVKLAKLKPRFAVGGERLTSKVVTGEFPIAINVPPRLCLKYALKGVKLRMAYPIEAVPAIPLVQVIMGSTKQPNISKLWIDWIRSKPGQDIFTKTCAFASGREGMPRIPKGVKPELAYAYPPRIEDLSIVPVAWKDVTAADSKKAREEWISIFAK